MMASTNSVRFYWKVTDHFRQQPGEWRMEFTEWTIRCPWPSSGGNLALRVGLEAYDRDSRGRFAVAARVGVKGGTTAAFSRAAARELGGLADRLERRGFRLREPFTFFPLAAYRVVPARAFASMRAFLSTLASTSPGNSAARGPKSMDEFLANFQGAAAGGWRPLLAAWELRKDIHITQHPATAILKLHIAPADLSGLVLGAASSVTIWPPWEGKGSYPAWLRAARSTLARQFRAAGHRVDWHRGPKGEGVMIHSMRDGLGGLADVRRERRALECMKLGDLGDGS